ncbi:MAG: hypothetical protein OEQ12_07110 [Nitrosopumilus sp.]|nr:hypothetical protein [Nitrosopumilus sp.]
MKEISLKSGITLTGLFFLVVISFTNHTEAYQTDFEDGLFIFVQTTVRNSEGQLIAYLESSKFTDLNLELLESFLDFEASRGNDPIVTINEKEYQVIRRVQSKTFQTEDLVASTILSDSVDGKLTMLARFAHDGYPVYQGDTLDSMWTFIRPVS